jgi:hypothetical protein
MEQEPLSTTDKEPLPETTQTELDENGHFTEVSWHYNDKGNRVKVTRVFKRVTTITKVKKSVLERRKWAQFGMAVGVPMEATTSISQDDVFLEPTESSGLVDIKPVIKSEPLGKWVPKTRITGLRRDTTTTQNEPTNKSGYVPPHQRNGFVQNSIDDRHQFGIRISNIEAEYDEEDLRDLLRNSLRLNPARVKLVLDHNTRESRGYAFINMRSQQEFDEALETINGKYLGYSVLTAEKVRPKAL